MAGASLKVVGDLNDVAHVGHWPSRLGVPGAGQVVKQPTGSQVVKQPTGIQVVKQPRGIQIVKQTTDSQVV